MYNYRDEDEFQRWRRYGHERGWFDRATDEVASWFGDDEAERRRDMDRMHDMGGQGRRDLRSQEYGWQGARQFERDSRLGGSSYEYSQHWNRPYGRDYGEQSYGTIGPINRWRLGGTEFGDFGTRPMHHGRGPRNYQRSDERIREDVIERLTRDPETDATDVEVQVANGEVTLRGLVEERWEKRRVEDICEDIFGVKNVVNHLKVRNSLGMQLGLQKPTNETETSRR